MTGEPCRICEAVVSFSDTVHVLLNPRGEEGVVDYYVCRNCYEERLVPLFDSGEGSVCEDTGESVSGVSSESAGVTPKD